MNSKIKFLKSCILILKVILITIFMGMNSCTKETEPRFKEFLIQVDSVSINYIPSLSDQGLFAIDLYGIISYNGCSSFSYCKTYIQDQDLIIEAWKKTDVQAIICPTVIVTLEHRLYFSDKDLPENYRIKIMQPDGTFLIKNMIEI